VNDVLGTPELMNLIEAQARVPKDHHAKQGNANTVTQTHAERVAAAVERERVRREARRLVDAEEQRAALVNPPQLVRLADVCDTVTATELVEGVITADSLTVLWGPSNAGKTTIALALMVALATGRTWCGRQCHRTRVAILAYEGRYGLRRRLDAAILAHGGDDPAALDMFVVNHPPKLGDAAGLAMLQGALREPGIGVVLVDTLSAACAGVLDIDAGAGGDAPKAVTALRTLLPEGGTVIAIHHCGHDSSRMRGAYALLAAVDTELHADAGILQTRKQRDLPSDFRVSYGIEPMHGAVVMTDGVAAMAPPPDSLRVRVQAELSKNPNASASVISKAVRAKKETVCQLVKELRSVQAGSVVPGWSPPTGATVGEGGSLVPPLGREPGNHLLPSGTAEAEATDVA
jgi:hypothetical protein